MAAENIVPLLSLQGFKGVDFSTAQPYLEPGQAVTASGANPTIVKGALLPERGRKQMFDFSRKLASISVIFPCVAFNYQSLYLVQGLDYSGNVLTELFNPATLGEVNVPGGLAFTEAVQYGSVVYTNAGQRLFLWRLSDNQVQPTFYTWQYAPPPTFTGNYTVAGGGNLNPGEYWYIYTRRTTMPDGSISETSVNLNEFAGNASVNAGVKVTSTLQAITITPAGFLFTGTNSDGTTFTTNLYRQSTNLPGYRFVANLTTNSAYVDTSSDYGVPPATDNGIISNAMLEVHRDQPPVITTPAGLNLGNIAIHKSRVWVFVNFADPSNIGLVQAQAWYSNPGRPWEFDDVSQVLLLDSDVATNVSNTTGYQYNQPYGNAPRGLAEVGTLLLAFKQREMWAILGDDQTNFVARTYFGIGCGSQRSITPAIGGCFWISDSGDVYWFDGSAPQYNSKDIRDFIRPIPGSPGLNPLNIRNAVGFYSNLTYYIAFPGLQETIGYSSPDAAWLSILPYAPSTAGAVAYVPANPNYYNGTSLNEVVAARAGAPNIVDWWFVDPNNDLGVPQTVTWQGGITASKVFGEKQYSYLTLFCPVGTQGSALVILNVDGVQIPWTIPDLSVPPRLLQASIGNLGGTVRGFMASLFIRVTGVAGQPAPMIWDVSAHGQLPPDRKLNLRI